LRRVNPTKTPDTEFTCLLAEATYQAKQKSEALRLYEDCLGQSQKTANGGPRSIHQQMMALTRLQRFDEAEVLVLGSRDSDLKAEYAGLLLDHGDTARATRFMAQNSPR